MMIDQTAPIRLKIVSEFVQHLSLDDLSSVKLVNDSD